jgi:predicted GIY-YIG superfamily endonuclease
MKKIKKAGIIYTVKCKITGEFYVGATTDSIKQRQLDHIKRAQRGEVSKFQEALMVLMLLSGIKQTRLLQQMS